jgi:DUF1009 family protein
LVLPEGAVTQRRPTAEEAEDIALAAEALRVLGPLDIGQAAISVAGRVVAIEGAEGTDALIDRIEPMRLAKRIPAEGGVLVKRAKPQQDRRFDLPTIGPETARRARRARLTGVAAEADATLLVGQSETIAAFEAEGLFLLGVRPGTAPEA